METRSIQLAGKELAAAIVECMNGVRDNNEDPIDIYAVVVAILDDFSDVQLYANTESNFASTDGTATDRWYFGQFWSEGMPLDSSALSSHLGEVESWDEDSEPANSNAVDWLAAMTFAMRFAKDKGAFSSDGKNATAYCSMVDSLNAIWLEDLSARFINDPDIYVAAADGIKAASAQWYQSEVDQGSLAFRDAYQSRLR